MFANIATLLLLQVLAGAGSNEVPIEAGNFKVGQVCFNYFASASEPAKTKRNRKSAKPGQYPEEIHLRLIIIPIHCSPNSDASFRVPAAVGSEVVENIGVKITRGKDSRDQLHYQLEIEKPPPLRELNSQSWTFHLHIVSKGILRAETIWIQVNSQDGLHLAGFKLPLR